CHCSTTRHSPAKRRSPYLVATSHLASNQSLKAVTLLRCPCSTYPCISVEFFSIRSRPKRLHYVNLWKPRRWYVFPITRPKPQSSPCNRVTARCVIMVGPTHSA